MLAENEKVIISGKDDSSSSSNLSPRAHQQEWAVTSLDVAVALARRLLRKPVVEVLEANCMKCTYTVDSGECHYILQTWYYIYREEFHNSVAVQKYIARYTDVPVPLIHASGLEERVCTEDCEYCQIHSTKHLSYYYCLMDRVPGDTLHNLRKVLSAEQLQNIYGEIRQHRKSLLARTHDKIARITCTPGSTGTLDTFGWTDPIEPDHCAEMFWPAHSGVSTQRFFSRRVAHFLQEIREVEKSCPDYSMGQLEDQICALADAVKDETLVAQEYPIVLTHNDLCPRNVMIDDGRVSGIIDWEFAGMYPVYYEYFRLKYFWGSSDDYADIFRVPDLDPQTAALEEVIQRLACLYHRPVDMLGPALQELAEALKQLQ